MDKKNTVIGVALLIAAMGAFYVSARLAPPAPAAFNPPATSVQPNGLPPPAAAKIEANTTPTDAVLTPNKTAPAEYVTLTNDYIEARFTNQGGAIDHVELRKYPAEKGKPAPYTLNHPQAAPALSFADFPGFDSHSAYALVAHTATEVVYRSVTDDLEVTRRYSLSTSAQQDVYQIRQETTFRNLGAKPLTLPKVSVNVGTASPLNDQDLGLYLNAGYFDGKNATFIARSALQGGGLLAAVGMKDGTPPPFIEENATVEWASVKNQFFTLILTPDQPGTGIHVERVKLIPTAPVTDIKAYGITSYARFDLKPLAARASENFGATLYAGPKEYTRLSNVDIFKHSQEKVMQFDSSFYYKMFFTGFVAPLLLTLMTWIHSGVGSWGWSIILTTLLLKTVFLPLTLTASRSSKRMAKLNPLMKAMREKYKDNPQKIQTETLKLFKEHKVNPLGGCIPMLITIPFFIGFYSMLLSASDLRFASFLWVTDLSAPDTVGHIFGLPLNIMPLFMGATMIVQMRLTPTPTTDNAQATLMKFMPWGFTLICYNFAAGLALYSAVNGLFTIVQQLIINRMPEVQLATAPTGDGMKNVTPKKGGKR